MDGFLGNESPSKEADSSCWGRKKKKKKKSLPEDTVSGWAEGSTEAVRGAMRSSDATHVLVL